MADRRDLPRAAAALGAAAACLSVASSGAAFAHGAVAAPGTMLRGSAVSARAQPARASAGHALRQAAAPASSFCGTLAGGSAAIALCSCAVARTPAARARGRASAVAVAAGAGDVSVILLSGGVGKRMGAKIPKQYLELLGREIALHSLEAFLDCDVKEIAIVCAEEYRSVFEDYIEKRGNVRPIIKYTGGGAERQDSVNNGLAQITAEYAAVHDSARPLVTKAEIEKVIADAKEHGAALLAVQTKATIKQAKGKGEMLVAATPDRSLLWEAHTPQVIRSEMLREGFKNAAENKLEVTDDVSLIESLGKPVKITPGEYTNLKVTTPEDIAVAETILRERGFKLE